MVLLVGAVGLAVVVVGLGVLTELPKLSPKSQTSPAS